jgi:hypothetical protein
MVEKLQSLKRKEKENGDRRPPAVSILTEFVEKPGVSPHFVRCF